MRLLSRWSVLRTRLSDEIHAVAYRVPILPYGTYWSVAGIRWNSRINGMTCRTARGHGFFLNRTAYRLW